VFIHGNWIWPCITRVEFATRNIFERLRWLDDERCVGTTTAVWHTRIPLGLSSRTRRWTVHDPMTAGCKVAGFFPLLPFMVTTHTGRTICHLPHPSWFTTPTGRYHRRWNVGAPACVDADPPPAPTRPGTPPDPYLPERSVTGGFYRLWTFWFDLFRGFLNVTGRSCRYVPCRYPIKRSDVCCCRVDRRTYVRAVPG